MISCLKKNAKYLINKIHFTYFFLLFLNISICQLVFLEY